MSWSINLIGKPDNLVEALEKKSVELNGKSKEEFDEVLPSLIKIIKLNYNSAGTSALRVVASGHAYEGHSQCSIQVESVGGIIV